MKETTSPAFFEALYAKNPDPWDFASNEYELARYAAIVGSLSHRRYLRAFEPGCSIGVLTTKLAPLCDQLIAVDVSHAAIERARENCSASANVVLYAGSLPQNMPDGFFDLIVFSEIGYYMEEAELLDCARLLISRLEVGGTLLAAHWLGESRDHVLGGRRVHELIHHLDGLVQERNEQHEGFLLETWTRP